MKKGRVVTIKAQRYCSTNHRTLHFLQPRPTNKLFSDKKYKVSLHTIHLCKPLIVFLIMELSLQSVFGSFLTLFWGWNVLFSVEPLMALLSENRISKLLLYFLSLWRRMTILYIKHLCIPYNIRPCRSVILCLQITLKLFYFIYLWN